MNPIKLRRKVKDMASTCSDCPDCTLEGNVPNFCEEHEDEFAELRELVESGLIG
jgi:hypothetical protein